MPRSSVSVCLGAKACSSSKMVLSKCNDSSWCCAKKVVVTLCPVSTFPLKPSVPAIILNKVDLPLPLAPIKAILSPFSIKPSAFSKISILGYDFETFSTLITCLPLGLENLKPVSYTHLDVYKRQI